MEKGRKPGRGSGLNPVETRTGRKLGGLGIDHMDGNVRGNSLEKGSGRVDRQGSADNEETVSGGGEFGGPVNFGNRLAEPDDVGPQLGTSFTAVAWGNVAVLEVVKKVGIDGAAGLEDFPVQVEDAGGAGAFVQVVDILRDEADPAPLFQLSQCSVGRIGPGFADLLAAGVVEAQHQLGITFPGFRSGHFIDIDSLPEPAVTAEGGQSAFSADAGPGQHHHMGIGFHVPQN